MPLPSSLAHNPNLIDHFLFLLFYLPPLISYQNLCILTVLQHVTHLLNVPAEYTGGCRDPSNPVCLAYKEAKKTTLVYIVH